MKNIKNYLLVLILVLGLGSCQKFLDVNTDPNNPTTVTPDLVLPVAQGYTATIMQRDRGMNHLGNMMMYNWSQSDGFSWYEDEFLYQVTSTFYERIFETPYTGALKQYQILASLEDSAYTYYKAIGMIMKAYHFQLLVDFYGDVPYSEALLRKDNATPVYDDALTIYESLITELTDAIALIEDVTVVQDSPEDDDAMFGGDMDMWMQFANTVKLRILVRQMSMTGRDTYIQAEFDVIAAQGSGYITDNVGINPGYIAEEVDKQNPMWDQLGAGADGTLTL